MGTDNKMKSMEERLIAKADLTKSPISAVLELLPLCNMNCAMCYVRLSREEMESKGRLRTAEEWIELAKEMQQEGVLFVLLTGGEPLLYPDFKKVYLALQEMGMIVSVNTNGTLIDDDWVKFFSKNKPKKMNITIYGGSEDTYERLCHYRGGYQKTLGAIEQLTENAVDVRINCTVTRENCSEVESITRWAKERELPIVIDTYMIPVKRERTKPFAQQSRLIPKEAAKARVNSWKLQLDMSEYKRNAREMYEESEKIVRREVVKSCNMQCHAGKSSFTVTWDGRMMPCLTLEKVQVDVFKEGFKASWKHLAEETDKIRINDRCAECRYQPFCRTCAACAIAETGDEQGIPQYMCEYAKESFRLMLD